MKSSWWKWLLMRMWKYGKSRKNNSMNAMMSGNNIIMGALAITGDVRPNENETKSGVNATN